ncbi:hypothetical protein O8W32_08590 [Methanomassiliicoccales archaeon LGM-DZ1]|nr:hypothetical protein O8W32_08590 [Methanomassiliicoccales archaeon LGM-DZ1]
MFVYKSKIANMQYSESNPISVRGVCRFTLEFCFLDTNAYAWRRYAMKQTVVHSVIVSWPRLILVFLVIGAILFASAIPAASAIESQSTNTGNTISFSKSSSINSSDDLCKILSGSNPDLTFTIDTDDYGDGRYAAFVTNGSDEKSIVGYNKDINVKLDVPAGYKFLVMVRCTNNSSSYAMISILTHAMT